MTESWFAALAAVMLVASLGGAALAAAESPDDGEETVVWRPSVPDVHDVEEPSADGTATVGGEEFDSIEAALEAAEPGETVLVEGVFEERIVVGTEGVTIAATEPDGAVVDGGGADTVVEITAENVTLDGLWVRGSGTERSAEDAGILIEGSEATVTELRLTDVTYGIYVDGAEDVTIEGTTIAGGEDVPVSERGNGIHLWEADGAEIRDNYVTAVRDGIYYQWSEGVLAEGNVLWELRYGVHYMYSDDNRFEGNAAFDNDVGFALMVSSNLTVVDNLAVANDGASSHGILVKDVDDSEIRGNDVVANGNGLYVYNSQDNLIAENLLLENAVGLYASAGTSGELVVGNSFVANDESAYATTNAHVAWNDDERGNYWSDARAVDLDGDGTSEVRHQPAGAVERLVNDQPVAAAFASSPAFDAIGLAESSFPVVDSATVVDERPLAEPPHEDWRSYYEDHDH